MAAPESAPPPHLSGPAAALQQLDTRGEGKGGGGGGGGGGGASFEPAYPGGYIFDAIFTTVCFPSLF